jgi:hypothetical protein
LIANKATLFAGNLFLECVSLPMRGQVTDHPTAEVICMTTFANLLGLFGMALIRFGERGGGGLVFLLFGLAVVFLLVWALTRTADPDLPRSSEGNSPAPGAKE